MSHSPLPWAVNADGDTVVSDHPEADEIVCNTAGRKIDAAFFSNEPDRCEDNAKLIVTAVNHHAKLFQALADLCEWDARMGFYDSPCWDDARKVLNAIRDERDGQQPEKLVFQQAKPAESEAIKLLAWFIAQFDGTSGAGVNHWIQSPEYRRACELIGQQLPPFDEGDEEDHSSHD
jgi:hypothetical protein